MIHRLEYGGYSFEHNPRKSTSSFEAMGDKITTINGRRIYQPTGFLKKQSFEGVIYQPRTQTKRKQKTNYTKLDFDNNENIVYFAKNNSQSIDRYNHNLKLIDTLTFTKNTDEEVVDVSSLGDYFWICVTNGTSERLLKVQKTDNTNQVSYSVGLTSGISGMTNDNNNIYLISDVGEIIEVTPSDGSQSLIVEMTSRSYTGITYDGRYFWSGEYAFDNSTVYQFTYNGQILNSLLEYIQNQQKSQYYNISSLGFDIASKQMYIILSDGDDHVLIVCNPNTVMAEVYTLEQELHKGKVYMTDHNNRKRLVHVRNFNPELSNTSLSVNITLEVNIED